MLKFFKRDTLHNRGKDARMAALEAALVDAKDARMRAEMEVTDAQAKLARHNAQINKLKALLKQEHDELVEADAAKSE